MHRFGSVLTPLSDRTILPNRTTRCTAKEDIPCKASSNEASAVSNINAAGFQIIQRTMRQVFPEALVAPALCVGGPDSEHYAELTNNIYRFSPLRLRPQDMKRLHGINERTSVKDYAESVKFYYQLISNSAQ